VPHRETPEGWAKLSSLIDVLLDTPVDERPALIDRLSGDDPARRLELDRLLAECERGLPLLNEPADERFATLLEDHSRIFPDILAERYRLTRELGRGGMATVFLARDLKHARDVAIKVVDPLLTAALGADRFLREIGIVAQLHHPHIVQLYDSGDANGSLYYVMPYEAGASLRDRLTRDGPLPIDDALLILRDVCDALAHAHHHGIVHRDIKPGNVLLSGRHAVVTDFGIAKALAAEVALTSEHPDALSSVRTEAATLTGSVLGTPTYMAPEQISGALDIDHRADIYALGVLAYELLTGRPPFVGETAGEVLSSHLTQTPPPLTTYRPDVPAALGELVMTCLAKRPSDRWQSTDEILRRLENLSTGTHDRAWLASPRGRRTALVAGIAAVAATSAIAVAVWGRDASADTWRDRWAKAAVQRVTDFPGAEVDAAISNDGRLVAFLADRDSVFDAFVTQVGSGTFANLTGSRFPQLYNEDVRNVGFSHDAAQTWIRVADIAAPASVSIAPTAGGPFRRFLETAVMVAWSPDGSKLAYHETTPGDPIFVADRNGQNPRRVFVAEAGLHSHHLTWSTDGAFLYFAHGLPPNEMDIWRVPSAGGSAERVTEHDSRVAYPVLLDERTLLYTATADDGTGPWLYSMDLERRISDRVSATVEHYVSVAASAEVRGQPRRLVATVSNPVVDLWAVPITDSVATEQTASRLQLPTARSAAPRFGPDGSVLYLASRGGADDVWRLSNGQAAVIWKTPERAAVGSVAVSPNGADVCFTVRRQDRSTLFCADTAGARARAVGEPLDVRGTPSWSPDGKWIAIAAKEGQVVRVFKIPVGGGGAVRLVDSVSSNPVWSPDGKFILYSGTPRARSVPLRAVTPDGAPYPVTAISVDRVGDSYRFRPGTSDVVVKLGGFRQQDFWLVDLTTGRRRQLTSLRPGQSLHRFDISPDGKRILFERVRENSDIALITLPPG